MGFFNIQAESNCLQCVSDIKTLKMTHSYFGEILYDCSDISKLFRSFQLLHFRRASNFVAHNLAKIALSNSDTI